MNGQYIALYHSLNGVHVPGSGLFLSHFASQYQTSDTIVTVKSVLCQQKRMRGWGVEWDT